MPPLPEDDKRHFAERMRKVKILHSVFHIGVEGDEDFAVVKMQLKLSGLPQDLLKTTEGKQKIAEIAANHFLPALPGMKGRVRWRPDLQDPTLCKAVFVTDGEYFYPLCDALPAMRTAMEETLSPMEAFPPHRFN